MSETQDKLVDCIVALNCNTDLLAKHNADPVSFAKEFGLSDDDLDLIVNQDYGAIRERLSSVHGAQVDSILTFHTAS